MVILCILAALGLALPPLQKAHALTTVFATVPTIRATEINGYKNDGLVVSSCGSGLTNSTSAVYLDASGVRKNVLDRPSSSNGASCLGDTGYGAEDGTLYGTRVAANQGWSKLVARKNGRELWATDTSSGTACSVSGSTSDKTMSPTSISEGPDGMLYMILVGNVSPQICDDRLIGVNPKSGGINFNVPIGGSTIATYPTSPRVWTYDSRIVVVDRSGAVREFDYTGSENTVAKYQFPVPTDHNIQTLEATSDGTILAMTRKGNPAASSPTLLYHKQNGTHGAIADSYAGIALYQIQVTDDGNVVGFEGSGVPRLDHFNLTNNTVTATYPSPNTLGYNSVFLQAYLEDSDGNQLIMWTHRNGGGGSRATSVDLYTAGSNTAETVFLKETKPNDLSNYPEYYEWSNGNIRNAVTEGSLYLGICQNTDSACFNSSNIADTIIYQVDIGNFGEPVGKGFERNGYVNNELEYVAMGDSYSSGEGNPPFLSTNNDCNRSVSAYPYLLESSYGLNYKLVDHVACSGAVMSEVLNGKYNEPAQTDALSDSTALVTISIGGNDAGFAVFATSCITGTCGPGSPAYTVSMGAISSPGFASNLETVYGTILEKASEAEVYVLGYPYVTPVDPSDPYCLPFQDSTQGAGITDSVAARNIVDALNDQSRSVINTINDSRLHFVDPTQTGSPFDGKDICATLPNFVYPQLIATHNWAHPNTVGQLAYADILAGALD
jgi:hypothetical protein